MKKERSVLEKCLESVCMNVAIDSKKCNTIYDYAKDTYDIPKGDMSDVVCLRISMSEVSEFLLFCLLDILIVINEVDGNVSDYYTKQEITKYSKSKYKVDKIKFPLRFKMIQVEDDQWIGRIDTYELMKLRAAQLINYNVNAQRTMQRVIKGDKEIYKISLNQTAVNEIKSSYENSTFIPNTITLNIPIDGSDEFYYDDNNNELVISKLEHFHILDAYHRFIALCKASDVNKEFNYNMELRIVNWDDTKAQTFIWQENKKTFLKKSDSESMNMNKVANIIVARLNDSIHCNMKGLINRNEGVINFGEMAELVHWFYVKNNKKENKNAMQLRVIRELTEDLNILTEGDITYLETHWNYRLLLSVMCVFNYYKESQEDRSNMCDLVGKVYNEVSLSKDKKFYNKTPRKVLIDEVMRIIRKNV